MQFMHALTTAVLIATFTLVGAVTSTNDTSIPSTLTIKEGIDPPTATPTASSINVTVSMTPNAYPTPTPDPGSNTTKSCDPCYCDGEKWDQLGSWQTLKNALMNSGVVRVTTIPGGYHVSLSYPVIPCRGKFDESITGERGHQGEATLLCL